jgi:plastocyanin
MIWRWLISFSAAVWLAAPHLAFAANVSGEVEITNSRDAAVRKHRDYTGVVLWLEPVDRQAPQPAAARRVQMVQHEKRFTPHILAIPVGSTVDFPNDDPIFHNAFSNFSGQPFDVGLYAPGSTKSVSFKSPGIVRVFCNIHPSMSAIIAVFATPWFVVTPVSGQFVLPNVPPGEYQLRIFHERAVPENLQALERRIKVPEGGLALPLISISETGFVPVPHMNKYGHEYPPASNGDTYPGAPK